MSKKLTITSDGDYYGQFSPLAYKLEIDNSDLVALDIFLNEGQTKENYLFEILNASGISFKHNINIGNFEEAKEEEGFGDFFSSNNDIIIESKNPSSGILIEMEPDGNILLCNALDKRDIIHVFTINTENYMDPPEIILEDLCNILTEIGASYEVI
tara:strand:+ start:149 stop:616 length:468 start_codon:yes stop_codon:yes gene_type:complete